jgi:hypothetical protein
MHAKAILLNFIIYAGVSFSQNADVDKVACLVNKIRSQNNAPPIRISEALNAIAQNHASDQARRKQMTHNSADGTPPSERAAKAGYQFRNYGENVAAGQKSEEQVMEDWVNSKGHLENIIRREFKELGVARAGTFWAQEFGTRINGQDIGTREPRCGPNNEVKIQNAGNAPPGIIPASPPSNNGNSNVAAPAPSSAAPVPAATSQGQHNVIVVGKSNPLRPDANPTPTGPAISVPYFTEFINEISRVINSAPSAHSTSFVTFWQINLVATAVSAFISSALTL